jgi:hypothetical protein
MEAVGETKPRSTACYHLNHDQCAGPENCGCQCHSLISIEVEREIEVKKLHQEVKFWKERTEYYEKQLRVIQDIISIVDLKSSTSFLVE